MGSRGSVRPRIRGPPSRMQNLVKLLDHLLDFFSRMELSSIYGRVGSIGSVRSRIIRPPSRMQNVVKLLDHLLNFCSRMELSSIYARVGSMGLGSTTNNWSTATNAKCCEVARSPAKLFF